jgi:hypothetical protein
MWGFVVSRTYNRRRDIHARFGGQRQGGIGEPTERLFERFSLTEIDSVISRYSFGKELGKLAQLENCSAGIIAEISFG